MFEDPVDSCLKFGEDWLWPLQKLLMFMENENSATSFPPGWQNLEGVSQIIQLQVIMQIIAKGYYSQRRPPDIGPVWSLR